MTSARSYYRLAAALALGTAVLLLWSVGALGIVGSGGRRDLVYVAALAVGLVGTLVARLRPHGMARAMAATAVAVLVAGAVALLAGWYDVPGASVAELLGLTVMFAVPFAVSAWLFGRSGEATAVATGP